MTREEGSPAAPGAAVIALAAFAALALPATPVAPVAAQDPGARTWPETASLAEGPHSRGCMLLERTIFNVDVLTLELRFGPVTADRIERAVRSGAERDSVARLGIRSRDAFARIEFVRGVGMDRFIDGVRTDLRRAADGGVIADSTFRSVSLSLPVWYSFLEDRGVREGDQLVYRIRGDTLHSGYRTADGEWLLQQTDVGAERTRSVLGSYLVEGSSFREALLDDLVSSEPADCPRDSTAIPPAPGSEAIAAGRVRTPTRVVPAVARPRTTT